MIEFYGAGGHITPVQWIPVPHGIGNPGFLGTCYLGPVSVLRYVYCLVVTAPLIGYVVLVSGGSCEAQEKNGEGIESAERVTEALGLVLHNHSIVETVTVTYKKTALQALPAFPGKIYRFHLIC